MGSMEILRVMHTTAHCLLLILQLRSSVRLAPTALVTANDRGSKSLMA